MCKRWRGDELTAENEKWGAKGKKKTKSREKRTGKNENQKYFSEG